MAPWVRNSVMLGVLTVWGIYMLVTLARGGIIDPLVLGIPGGVYWALNPTLKRSANGNGNGTGKE